MGTTLSTADMAMTLDLRQKPRKKWGGIKRRLVMFVQGGRTADGLAPKAFLILCKEYLLQ